MKTADKAVILSRAYTALQHGDSALALEDAQKILVTAPTDADANHVAGLALYSQNQCDEALPFFRRAIKSSPRNALMHANLGRVLETLGKLADAEAHNRRAIELDPQSSDAHNNLANVLKAQQRYEEAAKHYRETIRLNPTDIVFQYNLGALLYVWGKHTEARVLLEKVIQGNPFFAAAWVNLGVIYLQCSQFNEALIHLEKAADLAPRQPQILLNQALTLHGLGRLQEAITKYQEAFEIDPSLSKTSLNNLITIYEDLPDMATASKLAAEVLQNTAAKNALSAAIRVFSSTCDFARRDRALRLWYEHVLSGAIPAKGLLEINYSNELSALEIYTVHTEWAASIEGQTNKLVPVKSTGTQNKDKRLRVAYVSPDFRNHATAFFMQPVIASHDKSSFEVFCYHTHEKEDETTEAIRRLCTSFRNVRCLADEELIAQIQQDQIDILVDLAGHTERNRLTALARRPAPIQATYLGYPNTTGLSVIDYVIVDRYIAESSDAYRTEVLATLPECLVTFQSLPASLGSPRSSQDIETSVVFGSLNSVKKITAQAIECWAQILKAIPRARLLICYNGADATPTKHNILSEFERHDVTAERLLILGGRSRTEFLELYRQIDILLDTFPYTGTTTTCESLLMNVPLITLSGPGQCQRVSASILKHIGLSELIADSPDKYVEIAVSLSQNPERIIELKNKLPVLLQNSTLRNPERFTHSLEKLYWAMWERHMKGNDTQESLII